MKEKKLPRAPALYERKTKPSYGLGSDARDQSMTLHGDWKTNRTSLREHEAQVLRQLAEEIKEDLMTELTLEEALEIYGEELLLDATGAIAKKG